MGRSGHSGDRGGTAPAVVAVVLFCLAVTAALAPAAHGHPLSQGALDVAVYPDRVSVRARVTLEEVAVVTMSLSPAEVGPTAPPASVSAAPSAPATRAADPMAGAYADHARYLTRHLSVSADGRPLTGAVVRVIPEGDGDPAAARVPQQLRHVVYELEYRPSGPPATNATAAEASRPARIELRQDVLAGVSYAPGVSWEVTYVVRARAGDGPASEGLLLTGRGPLVYDCRWPDADPSSTAAAVAAEPPAAGVDRWRLARDFFGEGVHHILTGYDHLLFVAALVLAARTLLDLVKVVTAFTLAHTLTLTLSLLGLVRLPGSIVEPLIAASIVVVAAQNVFWPDRSRGWGRLAAAFFFGLFHGLGFAGGLVEAMSGTTATVLVLAIGTFSLGVEVGHQLVVVPLYLALRLARRARSEPGGPERVARLLQRGGSAAVCAAGVVYLTFALRASFAGA